MADDRTGKENWRPSGSVRVRTAIGAPFARIRLTEGAKNTELTIILLAQAAGNGSTADPH
jgi:hypothetical protein